MYAFDTPYVLDMLLEYGVLKQSKKCNTVWFELPDNGGYLLLYEDGDVHHTYYNPEAGYDNL